MERNLDEDGDVRTPQSIDPLSYETEYLVAQCHLDQLETILLLLVDGVNGIVSLKHSYRDIWICR